MEANEVEKVMSKITVVEAAINAVYDKLDNLGDAVDSLDFSGMIELEEGKKLTKKEKEKKYNEFLNKKFPKLATLLKEIDEFIEAVSFRIDEVKSNAESAIEDVSEAESMLSEAKEKLEMF